MDQRTLRRAIDALLFVYSGVPLMLLAAFYSFVVRARIELGRWPTPMSPDPKDLSFADDHMWWVLCLFVLTICCALPWLLMMWFRIKLEPGQQCSEAKARALYEQNSRTFKFGKDGPEVHLVYLWWHQPRRVGIVWGSGGTAAFNLHNMLCEYSD